MTSRHPSPLRYPGGKASIAPLLAERAGGAELWIELFAGGAGAAIAAVRDLGFEEAWIIERDPALAAFWRVALGPEAGRLAEYVERTSPTIELFYAAKRALGEEGATCDLDLAEAAFLVNRCSRSGIVSQGSGPIGGRGQSGRWTVASRFDGPRLAARLRDLAALAGRIRPIEGDGIGFAEELPDSGFAEEAFVFADPPYFDVGDSLYRAKCPSRDHARLAAALKALPGPWAATYGDHPGARRLYAGCLIEPLAMRHTAAASKAGEELLIGPAR